MSVETIHAQTSRSKTEHQVDISGALSTRLRPRRDIYFSCFCYYLLSFTIVYSLASHHPYLGVVSLAASDFIVSHCSIDIHPNIQYSLFPLLSDTHLGSVGRAIQRQVAQVSFVYDHAKRFITVQQFIFRTSSHYVASYLCQHCSGGSRNDCRQECPSSRSLFECKHS